MTATNRELTSHFFSLCKAVKVVFKKKNGDLRTMICTNKLEDIPKELHPKGDKPAKPPSEEVFNVYDLEAKGWRSFRFDSVITMESCDEKG